ncbi:V-type ATP synthase subunit F [Candidatus Parcubacteria bacterium]|nr:V-type ATP synthase subunit F [Candidatus Parcubacteria bacterium]
MTIAIVGKEKSILGFKALGVESFFVKEEKDIEAMSNKLKEKEVGIVFLMQETFEKFKSQFDFLFKQALPAVLVVPSAFAKEKTNFLKETLERALGTDKINLN